MVEDVSRRIDPIPIQRQKLTDAICREIESWIRSGRLSPGERIPSEREMADVFGVSRATVAKAIAQLETKGLLVSLQGGGTFVSEAGTRVLQNLFDSLVLLSPGTLDELIEARSILECEIAGLAAMRATTEDVQELERLITEMQSHTDDAAAFVQADLQFHLSLAKAARNQILYDMLAPVQDIIREQMQLGSLLPGAIQRAIYWHQRITEAVAARSVEVTKHAMAEHLKETKAEVELSWPRRKPKPKGSDAD